MEITEIGRASTTVRSLCELEWGKRERRGGVRSTRRRASDDAKKKKKNRLGVRYGDESKNREPTRVPGIEGILCDTTRRVRHNAAATREWHTRAPP
jgi:hypothetical protein